MWPAQVGRAIRALRATLEYIDSRRLNDLSAALAGVARLLRAAPDAGA
jgi:hypothetical protein